MCRTFARILQTHPGAQIVRPIRLIKQRFSTTGSLSDHYSLLLILLTAFATSGCSSKSSGISPSPTAPSTVAAADSNHTSDAKADADKSLNHATPESSKSSTASPAKVPGPPSPEQIAKWGIIDHQPLRLLECLDGAAVSYLQSMAISPDGKQFVLGGGQLTLWNLSDAWKSTDSDPPINLLADYKTGDVERPIRCASISPNGEWIAAGDQKGMLRIWGTSNQRELIAIRAHDGRLTQLAFSPDSQKLATTSYSGEVRVWKSSDWTKINSFKASDRELARIVFLSDTLLAVATNEASIWDVETGKKETVLAKGPIIGPAMGLSSDGQLLAFADSDSKTRIWNVQKSSSLENGLLGAAAHLIAFSHDGKHIATYSADSTIRIWDTSTGNILQVMDADGGKIVGIQWLPQCDALLVASEMGRVRIWGTSETAQSISIEPIELPGIEPISADSRKALSSTQLQRVVDTRSFPRLPGALPQWGDFGMLTYNVPASQKEAESFYRYCLEKAGWTESAGADSSQVGLQFRKDGCALNISFSPLTAQAPGSAAGLQISVQYAGNYDARWLPKFSPVESKSNSNSFSFVSYRTKASLTDVEVALLKQFHEAGWTAYTRLAASTAEEAESRTISMLQGGSVMTIFISRPADATDELSVQISVRVSNKSLPIPPDAGWIEFDSSTDLQLVANTKMDLKQTTEFFDTEMAAEGWLSREAGRHTKDEKSWLPYIRGQQDVLIRLVALADGGTRVIVGDAERSSWQLQKQPENKKSKVSGIEAADFLLPKGASAIKFDVDQKQISFEVPDVTPPKLAEQFVKQMESLEWKKEDRGVMSDEYVFFTFSKAKAEFEIRIRAEGKKSTALIGGNGLLWSKPLPTTPVRISYEAWLRRNRHAATLDRLDEFVEEMRKIPRVGK